MKSPKKKAAFFCTRPANIDRVYGRGRKETLAGIADLYPAVVTGENFPEHREALKKLEVIFSTWGMPRLSPEEFDSLPKLEAVFYAAGTVREFAAPLLERDILLVSAWAANAVPTAEFTAAQIILANKGYFANAQKSSLSAETRRQASRDMPGNFGETVALLGAGMIGRRVIGLLKPYELKVVVWDPFLTEPEAVELGVEKVAGLKEAFGRGMVVSNHLADVPETRHLLNAKLFSLMRPGACFINTGRGVTVAEDDLIAVFRERPDLTALLDVTDPDPPPPDSPLYSLGNIHLTSHIAGSLGAEVVRMADCVIDEFRAWLAGRPLRYAVTREILKTMA